MRIGSGYDVHRLVSGRPLILGGVEISFNKGLLGHSDADVLIHAVCDALLGALGLGDLGQHFPDGSAEFKDISSIILLGRCVDLMRQAGYRLVNLDATVLAQAPKLAPYKAEMEMGLAKAFDTDAARINVKATTAEGLGYIGRGEGMAAECVLLIERS
ncbi:MAG: 2-C-methyl-D-erythritol 2,4-cyclodiphosphate synthase [Desulfobacteraceae bacterium]|jgi:2-C-methyl-D-erythritol 2,4-cyclodiphosphate synthase